MDVPLFVSWFLLYLYISEIFLLDIFFFSIKTHLACVVSEDKSEVTLFFFLILCLSSLAALKYSLYNFLLAN